MTDIAVICEYNLFHNGHIRQLEKIRSAYPGCRVLSLMSGSFVQRGEPAILPKYLRAEAAVRSGADLVLELPFPYSCSGARYFAEGAVRLLDSLRAADILCFGSESGDLAALSVTAGRLASDEYEDALTSELHGTRSYASRGPEGASYAAVREEVYRELYGEGYPERPNDILGAEYLTALGRCGSPMKPFTVRREGTESATAARALFASGDLDRLAGLVPHGALGVYRAAPGPASFANAERLLLGWFRLRSPEELSCCAELTGGLEYRICAAAAKSGSAAEFFGALATKRYTDARLRRAVLACLLGIKKADIRRPPAYTVLLAANGLGRELLADIKRRSDFPVITKPADYIRWGGEVTERFALSLRAESIYALMTGKVGSASRCVTERPYITK